MTVDSLVCAAPDQVSCPLGDETAILNLKTGVYYGLNPLGSQVWTLLDGRRSLGEVRDQILARFDIGREECERDLLELLERLAAEGLVRVVAAAGR